MAQFKIKSDIVNAEQWFPGKYVEGVIESVYDPGDGTTCSAGYGYFNEAKPYEEWCVRPGYWIVRYENGIATIVPEHIFFESFDPVLT